VLFILFVLFVVVKGLQRSGLLLRLSQRIEGGQFIPLKLVIATFCLSMLVTNDVALTVIVPLTLFLNIDRKDVLVILEALAANAGSALTLFGNPQNLFIYWFYQILQGLT
jgi:Na+/H+ antiporter NhaD/arsenite permease-like protein